MASSIKQFSLILARFSYLFIYLFIAELPHKLFKMVLYVIIIGNHEYCKIRTICNNAIIPIKQRETNTIAVITEYEKAKNAIKF